MSKKEEVLSPDFVLNEQKNGAEILDIRTKEAFAKAHIPKSINVPLSPAFAAWVKKIIPLGVPLIIVSDLYPIQGVIEVLLRTGFQNIRGVLSPFQAWLNKSFRTDCLDLISIHNLNNQVIIDVRTDDEWKEGHIAAAIHIQIEEFENCINHIPKDKEIAVICASGNRASIFASLLKKEGFEKVGNVVGGMLHWSEEKLPIVKE